MIDNERKEYKNFSVLVAAILIVLNQIFAFVGEAVIISWIFRVPLVVGFLITILFYFAELIFMLENL